MRFSTGSLALVASTAFAAQEGFAEAQKRAESNSELVYGTVVIGGTASYTTVVPISTHTIELYVSGGHLTTVSSDIFITGGTTHTSSIWIYPDNELFTTVTTGKSTTTELASVLTTTSVSGITNQVIWVSPVPPTSTKPVKSTATSDASHTSKKSSTSSASSSDKKSSSSSTDKKSSSSSTDKKSTSSATTSSDKTSKTTKPSSTTAAPKSSAKSTTVRSTTSKSSSSTTVVVTSASTAKVATISGVTANTKITTTDSSGHKTVIPVLFGCSFCGGAAIELFGGFGPAPGVYEWPDLPKFSGLPAIDIDDSGDPSEDKSSSKPQSTATKTSASKSSSKSSSSSCTRSSVTRDIHVTCTVETASGQSTASKTCKTVTETVTGCDLRATDQTTTTTVSGACWTYSGVPITPNDDPSQADDSTDDDSSSSKKRSVAGRIEYEVQDYEAFRDNSTFNYLERRGTGSITEFGGCKLEATPNGEVISYPNWPGARALQSRKGLDSQQFWWLVAPVTCPNVAQLKWNNGVKLGKSQVTDGKQSSDHSYEKALLTQFLTSVLGNANSATCTAFNNIFVATPDGEWVNAGPPNNAANQGNPNVKGQCRLQSLYNELPNMLNYAFVGVDQNVNDMKGKFFNPELDGFPNIAAGSSTDDTETNLNIWNQMGMALDFLKESIVIQQYQVGNAAILGALNRFDVLWTGCGQNTPLNLGSSYQAYMRNLYNTNLASIAAKATAVSNSLVAHAVTTDAGGQKNNFYTAIENLKQTYPVADMSFPTAQYLNFPDTTNQNIKRDATACSATATASTSGKATTTASTSGKTTAAATSKSGSTAKSATSTSSVAATTKASATGKASSLN